MMEVHVLHVKGTTCSSSQLDYILEILCRRKPSRKLRQLLAGFARGKKIKLETGQRKSKRELES